MWRTRQLEDVMGGRATPRQHRYAALVTGCAFALSSCAHSLDVKNLSLYKPDFINSQEQQIKVGVIGATNTPEEERLLLAAVNALKRDGFKVTYPFYAGEESRSTVDYIAKVSTSSEYKGSGWNFLINWPGFLVWTPAWHGYKYRALYTFDIDISHPATKTDLPRLSVPVDLDIRHADMNRTWTELSWLEYSVIAFVGGIIFTRYDKSLTPQLLLATESKIGDYMGSKIASNISAVQLQQVARKTDVTEDLTAAEASQPQAQ
jgi:hypothetical protein